MNKLLIISILVILISCGQSPQSDNSDYQGKMKDSMFTEIDSNKTDNETIKVKKVVKFKCFDFDFQSPQEQADSLTIFMNRARSSDSLTKNIWEQKFFCAFPNSFNQMESLFGYDNELGVAPLYSTESPTNKYMDKRIFSDVIGYFSELKSIPHKLYYKKYTNINIDGDWQADNIRGAFGFHYKLISDTKNSCQILSKYSDKEIKSVFRFIFDGPHPKNEHNDEIYKDLKPLIDKQNERLGKLLTLSFDELMSEDDGHGH